MTGSRTPAFRRRQMSWTMRQRLNSARGSLPPLVFKTVRATLAAHGSSIDRTPVMSTLFTGVLMSSPVYLVMTVTVNGR
jgi:hypothetical protein